jgi:hypothetical protein
MKLDAVVKKIIKTNKSEITNESIDVVLDEMEPELNKIVDFLNEIKCPKWIGLMFSALEIIDFLNNDPITEEQKKICGYLITIISICITEAIEHKQKLN